VARDQFAALLPVAELALGADHPDILTARGYLGRWKGDWRQGCSPGSLRRVVAHP
jgi:hypothetical protein